MTREQFVTTADDVARLLHWPCRPKFKLVDNQRGKAHTSEGWFDLPKWLLNRHESFQRYYLIHEMCHFKWQGSAWGVRSHSLEMRELECFVNAHFGGLILFRGEAYLESIVDLATGQHLCDGFGRYPGFVEPVKTPDDDVYC